MMRGGDLVGNIFLLDKHINIKTILISLIPPFIIVIFKLLLEKELVISDFTIKELMYSLLAISMLYIIYNIKLIYLFFKEYFIFNILLSIGTIFEVLIFISILRISNFDLYSWIIGTFWLFSGLLRVLIQFSKAIFIADIQQYMKIISLFAYSRASYFAIIIINIFVTLNIKSSIINIFFLILLVLIDIWFIANLYPYMIKHENVKNVIELIRIIKEQKRIKINQLKNLTYFSESYFNKIIERFSSVNYIKIENKRVELGNVYTYINKI